MRHKGVIFLSPGHFNKLTIYNSTKKSLPNTDPCLRDPRIETHIGGHLGINEERRKEENADGLQTQPCSQELTAWGRRGKKVRGSRHFPWLGGRKRELWEGWGERRKGQQGEQWKAAIEQTVSELAGT